MVDQQRQQHRAGSRRTASLLLMATTLLAALALFPHPALAQLGNTNFLLSPVINIGNVQIFGGPDSYLWSVVKQPSVPRVRVAAGTAEKATVGYTVRVTRQVKPEGFRVTGNIVINNPSNANTASLANGIVDNTNVTLRIREVLVGVTTFSGSGGETSVPAMCNSYTLEPKFSTTCTFVSSLLQPQAGQLTARLFLQQDYGLQANFQRSYVQSLPVPFSFTDPSGGQLGCASVTDAFSGRLTPSGFRGSPPNQKVCESQTFAYTAEFGPYKTTDCQTTSVVNTVALNPDGGRGQTAQASVDVEIYGCDATAVPAVAAPVVPVAPPAIAPPPAFVQPPPGMMPQQQMPLQPIPGAGGFPGGFVQQPAQSTAPAATVQSAAISAPPLATGPAPYKWVITTEQSTGKVSVVSNGRQTQRVTYKVVFKRTGGGGGAGTGTAARTGGSSTTALFGGAGTPQGPRVEGTIALTNPTARPVSVAGLAADVLGAGGQGGVLATAPARCPSAVLAAGGTILCPYSIELPPGSESWASGGRAFVVARAALPPVGTPASQASLSMSAPVAFATAPAASYAAAAKPAASPAAAAAGRCARLSTSYAVTQGNRAINMAIDAGGAKPPSDLEGGERFCGESKTYTWTLQVGPLGGDEACGGGATVVQAVSRAFPLGVANARPSAVATDLAVQVQCPRGKKPAPAAKPGAGSFGGDGAVGTYVNTGERRLRLRR
jgi:hypothetical protein